MVPENAWTRRNSSTNPCGWGDTNAYFGAKASDRTEMTDMTCRSAACRTQDTPSRISWLTLVTRPPSAQRVCGSSWVLVYSRGWVVPSLPSSLVVIRVDRDPELVGAPSYWKIDAFCAVFWMLFAFSTMTSRPHEGVSCVEKSFTMFRFAVEASLPLQDHAM